MVLQETLYTVERKIIGGLKIRKSAFICIALNAIGYIFEQPASTRNLALLKLPHVRREKVTCICTVVMWTSCTSVVMDTLEQECCFCGYHIYAHKWEAAFVEVLDCLRKPYNTNDCYAMAAVKSDTIEKQSSTTMRCIYMSMKKASPCSVAHALKQIDINRSTD